MRITSDLFVAQLVRRVFSAGGFAAVERRGAEMAGAIFLVERGRDGTVSLFGPAAQTMADEDGARRFMRERVGDADGLQARFDREARFDPDFWVVEIEGVDLADYVDLVTDPDER